jgi:hypothetical protein
MNADRLSQIIIFAVFAISLWYGFFFLYKQLVLDYFRQRMFELRDSMFDLAADGIISFDDPAYGLLRKTINGFLRFGHRISFIELFIAIFVMKNDPVYKDKRISFHRKMGQALHSLPEDKARIYKGYRNRMNEIVIIQLLCSSPVSIIAICIGLVIMKLPGSMYEWLRRNILGFTNSIMRKPLSRITSTAMTMGSSSVYFEYQDMCP